MAAVALSSEVPEEFQRFTWCGRGPVENYDDRAEGAPIGVYSSTVDDQCFPYAQPQDYGNHGDVRWATLTDGRSGGLLVAGDLNVAVDQYDDADRAVYPHALQRNKDGTTLRVSHAVSGVSETFHETLPGYQVDPGTEYAYSVPLRPLSREEVLAGGQPQNQVACTPSAALVPVEDGVEPGETIDAKLTGDDDAVPIAVDVTGAKVLRLKVAVGVGQRDRRTSTHHGPRVLQERGAGPAARGPRGSRPGVDMLR